MLNLQVMKKFWRISRDMGWEANSVSAGREHQISSLGRLTSCWNEAAGGVRGGSKAEIVLDLSSSGREELCRRTGRYSSLLAQERTLARHLRWEQHETTVSGSGRISQVQHSNSYTGRTRHATVLTQSMSEALSQNQRGGP